jgi:hypothetical protein
MAGSVRNRSNLPDFGGSRSDLPNSGHSRSDLAAFIALMAFAVILALVSRASVSNVSGACMALWGMWQGSRRPLTG